VLARYPRLKARRHQRARAGRGELLEISGALIMDPEVILIDEPSIGLEPRNIEMVFATLRELRDERGKTLAMCWSEGAWSKQATARSYSPIPVSAGSFLADD